MYKRRYDKKWNFQEGKMNDLNHLLHPYPAMMMPLIARQMLQTYGNGKDISVLDPYMGSGTTIVESMYYGVKEVFGFDLNPLAVMIAKAKTIKYDIVKLHNQIDRFVEYSQNMNYKKEINDDFVNFSIRDSWFLPRNIKELDFIKRFIDELDEDIKLFFNVTFSQVVRKVSFTRNGEFKLYRIEEKKRALHNPNALEEMRKQLNSNEEIVIKAQNVLNYKTDVEIHLENAIDICNHSRYKNRFDMIITSPPYGDSHTTVAYGQFSRLANEWLGIKLAAQVDSKLMGGKNGVKIDHKFGISELDDAILQIIEKDKQYTSNRSKDVISFYIDYLNSIKSVAPTVKVGGVVVYVVGNRRVRDVELPLDIITAKAFEMQGFEHVETIVRDILNKRMPSKASPENEAGYQVSTMMNEYIVVLKKRKGE